MSIAWEEARPSPVPGMAWTSASAEQRADPAKFMRQVYIYRAIMNTTTRHERERIARHAVNNLPCWCCKDDLQKILADFRRMAG
jgi:hypothetical protein